MTKRTVSIIAGIVFSAYTAGMGYVAYSVIEDPSADVAADPVADVGVHETAYGSSLESEVQSQAPASGDDLQQRLRVAESAIKIDDYDRNVQTPVQAQGGSEGNVIDRIVQSGFLTDSAGLQAAVDEGNLPTEDGDTEGDVIQELFENIYRNMSEDEKVEFLDVSVEFYALLGASRVSESSLVNMGMKPGDADAVLEILGKREESGSTYLGKDMFALIARHSYDENMTIPRSMQNIYAKFINLERSE